MVNPFNGEGIGFAMETARIAAECVGQALARPEGASRERALHAYPVRLRQALGSYYRLGTVFSRLIGNPKVMRAATRHGMPRILLMRQVLKLMAGLYDVTDGDLTDRVITTMTRLVPSA
jgi:flavin-dependent dehydrogenase